MEKSYLKLSSVFFILLTVANEVPADSEDESSANRSQHRSGIDRKRSPLLNEGFSNEIGITDPSLARTIHPHLLSDAECKTIKQLFQGLVGKTQYRYEKAIPLEDCKEYINCQPPRV